MKIQLIKLFLLGGIVLLFVGCAKEKKKEEMSFDELKKRSIVLLQEKKYEDASEYLEQIIGQFQDRADISKYKLSLAELYFKTGKYESAGELYENFAQFYPSDQYVEYAKYRSILSKFYQTLRTDCDQTPTQETIKLCEDYLSVPQFAKYHADVSDIKNTCEYKLIDKEVYVYDFYVNQGEYTAAKGRLDFLKKNYLAKQQSLEPRLLYLESKLAQKEKNISKVKENLQKLMEKYPESHFTQMTHALLNKPNLFF
jgi:outer membrane assembly lipoprotein YfiO